MANSVCKTQDEIGAGKAKPTLTPELAVVQDADRLTIQATYTTRCRCLAIECAQATVLVA